MKIIIAALMALGLASNSYAAPPLKKSEPIDCGWTYNRDYHICEGQKPHIENAMYWFDQAVEKIDDNFGGIKSDIHRRKVTQELELGEYISECQKNAVEKARICRAGKLEKDIVPEEIGKKIHLCAGDLRNSVVVCNGDYVRKKAGCYNYRGSQELQSECEADALSNLSRCYDSGIKKFDVCIGAQK